VIKLTKIAACAGLLFGVCAVLDIKNVYESLGAKMLILLSFPAALWAIGFYSEEEKDAIRRTMHAAILRMRLRSNSGN
jgi:hypothetical protein